MILNRLRRDNRLPPLYYMAGDKMARPVKEGLDYFPLDVDMDQDDKIALIEAQHGLVGFGIVVKLLMKIYKHSYYYEWTEKEQLLFSKRVNVDINSINAVINDGLKWGLFNKNIYETYKILTSKGIQKRYLEAIGRRQKVKLIKEYLLLDSNDINAYKNLIIVDINPTLTVVNDNINTQSKVKKRESKVKESKEENNVVSDAETLSQLSLNLCKYYETLKPGQSIASQIDALAVMIDMYSYDWCKEALQKTVSKKGYFIKSYMEGILRNWKTDGKVDKQGNVNGIPDNVQSGLNLVEQIKKEEEENERKRSG